MKEDSEKDWEEVDEEWEEEAKRLMEEKEMNEKNIIEELAALEREQWSHWTRYFLEFDNEENRKRWKRQMHSTYEHLSEKEKESDRVWARKVLEIIGKDRRIIKKEPPYYDEWSWRDPFG